MSWEQEAEFHSAARGEGVGVGGWGGSWGGAAWGQHCPLYSMLIA